MLGALRLGQRRDVSREREACALICDEFLGRLAGPGERDIARALARHIRERGPRSDDGVPAISVAHGDGEVRITVGDYGLGPTHACAPENAERLADAIWKAANDARQNEE